MNITHRIVKMTRSETSGSKSPMWRCETVEGTRVNVFQHSDPAKNNYKCFADAGYSVFLDSMAVDDVLSWNNSPIGVQLAKNGQWWEVVAVAERLIGDTPDAGTAPDHQLYQTAVQQWAKGILSAKAPVVVWDTETTGLGDFDEIIQIAAIDLHTGEVLIDSLIQPLDMSRVNAGAESVNGISPAALKGQRTFKDLYAAIRYALGERLWLIYNAQFDASKLEANCIMNALPPISPLGIADVMTYFACHYGEWDYKRLAYKNKPLQFAAEFFHIDVGNAHSALDDAQTTRQLVLKLAEDLYPF